MVYLLSGDDTVEVLGVDDFSAWYLYYCFILSNVLQGEHARILIVSLAKENGVLDFVMSHADFFVMV